MLSVCAVVMVGVIDGFYGVVCGHKERLVESVPISGVVVAVASVFVGYCLWFVGGLLSLWRVRDI